MVTKGDWKASFHYPHAVYATDGKRPPNTTPIADMTAPDQVEMDENSNFIAILANACKEINPDNPLAVAESIKDMYEALKGLAACFRNIEILSRVEDDLEKHQLGVAVDVMTKALAKVDNPSAL